MKYSKFKIFALATVLSGAVSPSAKAATHADQRAGIQKMEQETLGRRYVVRPDVRDEIQHDFIQSGQNHSINAALHLQ